MVLVGLLIGVMIKDSKGQPAQPSNKEKVDDNGYNGQCFVNGTCSDGHLLRATNAETLKVWFNQFEYHQCFRVHLLFFRSNN